MDMDKSFVRELHNIAWFSACGQPFAVPLPFSAEQVSSWEQAITLCSSQAWEDVTLDARNRLTEFLHSRHRDEYQRWNGIAVSAKELVISSLCDTSWRPFAESRSFPKSFLDSASWDVLGAVMEHEYRNCKGRPDFFLQLLQVYRAGHFPCGWSGRWPGGRLLVW